MKTIKKPLAIAHRGYSSRFPENTLEAFDEALKNGADGFECDLRMTSDGQIVVFHDDHLKRLCGIKGSIETSLWKDLQSLRILQSQHSMPSLEEILVQFHTARINLELKSSDRPGPFVEVVVRTLGKIRPQGEIWFSSFDREVLRTLQTMDPTRKLGARSLLVETSDIERLPFYQREFKADSWNVPRQILDRPWKQTWDALGEAIPPVWIWTLDEAHDWARALQSPLPVEALISNRPVALRDFLDQGP